MQNKRRFFQSQQNIAALAAALLFLLASLLFLLQTPRPGMLDSGLYDLVLPKLGLARGSYYAEEAYYTQPNELFTITKLPWAGLLQLSPMSSLVYPAALVSFLCGITGQPFSTVLLAVLLDLFLALALFVLVKALCSLWGGYGVLGGSLWSVCILCGNYLLFFNSLYSSSMFVVSLTAFGAAVFRALALLRRHPHSGENNTSPANISAVRIWLPAAVTGLLLTTSSELSALLLLPTALIVLYLGFRSVRQEAAHFSERTPADAVPNGSSSAFRMRRGCFCVILVTGLLILCSVRFVRSNNEVFNRTNLYHSFFDGVLTSSEDPQQTLADFGMDSQFLQDMGKSAYLSDDDYYISPNGEQSNEIYSHISYGRILCWYLQHPAAFVRLISSALSQTGQLDTSRCVILSSNTSADALSGTAAVEKVHRSDYWDLLRGFCLRTPSAFLLVSLFCLVSGIVFFLLRRRGLGAALMGIGLGDWLVLAAALLSCGTADLTTNLFYYHALLDVQLCALLTLLGTGVQKAYLFIACSSLSARTAPEALFPAEPYSALALSSNRRFAACRRSFYAVMSDSRRFALCACAFSLLVMVYVLFIPRIGAYNNGDFGRMMSAMGLVYTPEDYFDPSVQCVKVVERYDYLEEYDWTSIRPDKVELTQSWISAGMRILYEMTGLPFSTAILAAIHLLVLTICLYQILRAAHRHLGWRPALLTMALYLVMFCGSYNLGWLNSLFGEGIAFIGLMMVLSASVQTIEQAADGNRRVALLWLALASVYLSCAKAQYVLMAPVLLLWWLILALTTAHSWKKRVLQLLPAILLTAFLGTSAIGVYRNNDGVSSQDTLYSALLNGILLYADDPVEALEELHLDTGLVADIGKHPYLDKSEYYCAPRTEMSEELIYSKVSTVDYLIWYLHHPKAFWHLLDDTAAFSASDMPDYNLYVGERNDVAHRTVNKFNFWAQVRTWFVPHTFLQYLLLFGAVYIACLKVLLCRSPKTGEANIAAQASTQDLSVHTNGVDKTSNLQRSHKLYALLLMVLIALGAIQYPLPMVGNGFSDPIKQLYLFREVYDLVLLVILVWVVFCLIPGIAARLNLQAGKAPRRAKDKD